MAHDRKLVLGAVALVKARVRNDMPAMAQIRDELEPLLVASGWFPNAPFRWVSLMIRYGLKTSHHPQFERISKKHGDLPIAVEVDTTHLLEIHTDPFLLKAFLKAITIHCLIAVGKKYKLPTQTLELELEAVNAA
jgi:hypothetical protein